MSHAQRELKDLLSHHMLEHPYDPDSTLRENFVIDHLVEEVLNYEVGDNSYQELKAIFRQQDTGTFDFDKWMQSKVDSGEYFPPDTSE